MTCFLGRPHKRFGSILDANQKPDDFIVIDWGMEGRVLAVAQIIMSSFCSFTPRIFLLFFIQRFSTNLSVFGNVNGT